MSSWLTSAGAGPAFCLLACLALLVLREDNISAMVRGRRRGFIVIILLAVLIGKSIELG